MHVRTTRHWRAGEKKMKIQVEAIESNKNSAFKSIDYKICLPLSGDTQVVKTLSENEMKELLDDISIVLGYKSIMEKFNCTIEDATSYKVEEMGICEKLSDGKTWEMKRKLRIKISK